MNVKDSFKLYNYMVQTGGKFQNLWALVTDRNAIPIPEHSLTNLVTVKKINMLKQYKT